VYWVRAVGLNVPAEKRLMSETCAHLSSSVPKVLLTHPASVTGDSIIPTPPRK
jgi:hypothetical protein